MSKTETTSELIQLVETSGLEKVKQNQMTLKNMRLEAQVQLSIILKKIYLCNM
jgi:hypothetical protein